MTPQPAAPPQTIFPQASADNTQEDDEPIMKRRRLTTTVAPSSKESGPAIEFSRQREITTPTSMSQASGYAQALIDEEAQAEQTTKCLDDVETASGQAKLAVYSIPFHKILSTTVTLEYGENLEKHCIMHLELLCQHSDRVRQLVADSEELHKSYSEMKSIRQSVKSILLPQPMEDDSRRKANVMASRAMNLIIYCYKKLPLPEYQIPLRKCLANATDSLFQNGENWKVPPSKSGIKKKDYPPEDVLARLQLLKEDVLPSVIDGLRRSLQRAKCEELAMARNEAAKAMALRRLILPDVSADAIETLCTWIYKGTLKFSSANQLCKAYSLARTLDIRALANECMSKLSTAAIRVIKDANVLDISLRELINEPKNPDVDSFRNISDPLSHTSVVRTIFTFVLGETDPPGSLRELVISAIADASDPALIADILPALNHDMRGDILVAISRKMARKTENGQAVNLASIPQQPAKLKVQAKGN